MSDVIVIGGGVIGLTAACELADRGLTVTLLDRQAPGREASWAGAGILPPGLQGNPERPLARMTAATQALWPDWSQALHELTGIDNGFRTCGGINFAPEADDAWLTAELADWREAGVVVSPVDDAELRQLEPAIDRAAGRGLYFPGTCQVRNPRHLRALLVACGQRGVDVRGDTPVVAVERSAGQVSAVRTPGERLTAGAYLVTSGAWSHQLLADVVPLRPVEPIRGQILLLSTYAPRLRHVIECGPRYLVPRPDGRTLIGSTEERVGFEKRNTPAAMRDLLDFAVRLVPSLADARFEQAWSGLRPHTVGGVPLIGRVSELQNLFVATGHFRAGLHLSPITARLLGQLMTGEATDIPLEDFDPRPPCPPSQADGFAIGQQDS